MIMEDCRERQFCVDAAMLEIPLGLYVIRGDNIAVIGEMDENLDSQTDWTEIRASALRAVTH